MNKKEIAARGPSKKDLFDVLNSLQRNKAESEKLAELRIKQRAAEQAVADFQDAHPELAKLEKEVARLNTAYWEAERKESQKVVAEFTEVRNLIRMKGVTPEVIKAVENLVASCKVKTR